MSQDDVQRQSPGAEKGTGRETEGENVRVTPSDAPEPAAESLTTPAADRSETVGTGTSIALGCVAGTILLIIFGLLFLALVVLL